MIIIPRQRPPNIYSNFRLLPSLMLLYLLLFFFFLPFFPLAYQGHGCGRQSNPHEQSGTQSTFAAGAEAGNVGMDGPDRVFKLNHVVIWLSCIIALSSSRGSSVLAPLQPVAFVLFFSFFFRLSFRWKMWLTIIWCASLAPASRRLIVASSPSTALEAPSRTSWRMTRSSWTPCSAGVWYTTSLK